MYVLDINFVSVRQRVIVGIIIIIVHATDFFYSNCIKTLNSNIFAKNPGGLLFLSSCPSCFGNVQFLLFVFCQLNNS